MAEMSPGDACALEMALSAKCCGDDSWRGRLCGYHQGIADGYDMALEGLTAAYVTAAPTEEDATDG